MKVADLLKITRVKERELNVQEQAAILAACLINQDQALAEKIVYDKISLDQSFKVQQILAEDKPNGAEIFRIDLEGKSIAFLRARPSQLKNAMDWLQDESDPPFVQLIDDQRLNVLENYARKSLGLLEKKRDWREESADGLLDFGVPSIVNWQNSTIVLPQKEHVICMRVKNWQNKEYGISLYALGESYAVSKYSDSEDNKYKYFSHLKAAVAEFSKQSIDILEEVKSPDRNYGDYDYIYLMGNVEGGHICLFVSWLKDENNFSLLKQKYNNSMEATSYDLEGSAEVEINRFINETVDEYQRLEEKLLIEEKNGKHEEQSKVTP